MEDDPAHGDHGAGAGSSSSADAAIRRKETATVPEGRNPPSTGTRFLFQTSGSVLSLRRPVVVSRAAAGPSTVPPGGGGGQRRTRDGSLAAHNAAAALLLHSNHLAMLGPFLSKGALSLAAPARRPALAAASQPPAASSSCEWPSDEQDHPQQQQEGQGGDAVHGKKDEPARCGDVEVCCGRCGSHDVMLRSSNDAVAGEAALLSSQPGRVPSVTCKLLVVGNAKCGKTSVIRRLVEDAFSTRYVTTIGADYVKKDVTLQDGSYVRLQLWDIAGQDRFAKLTRAYFSKARGVLVVCDLTRENTFDAVAKWKAEIDEWARIERREGIPVVLIANKCDLLTDPSASFLAGANMVHMCHQHSFASWYVTSAKSGSNILNAFSDLVERAMVQEYEEDDDREQGGRGGRGSQQGGFRLSSQLEPKRGGREAGWSAC